jgi:hypothetical protein
MYCVAYTPGTAESRRLLDTASRLPAGSCPSSKAARALASTGGEPTPTRATRKPLQAVTVSPRGEVLPPVTPARARLRTVSRGRPRNGACAGAWALARVSRGSAGRLDASAGSRGLRDARGPPARPRRRRTSEEPASRPAWRGPWASVTACHTAPAAALHARKTAQPLDTPSDEGAQPMGGFSHVDVRISRNLVDREGASRVAPQQHDREAWRR